ncbi:MAG: CRISPR-associated protein Cas4 [Clostridium sp. 44_14]|jgi:CRISPR-associated exonuclease Cas4|nr:MAG: CRISPR-associated protein Cas4 [Clostridium sp. 44_14]
MEYAEEDYLMISGIQHFRFCRRQWALIHVEQQWEENVHTIIGEVMHKRAHDPYLREKRKDTIVVRALPVASKTMGVSGECDIVEFHRCDDGIRLFGHRGLYSVYPIEYKKGKPKNADEDQLQLTAQAMCLEEMFTTTISEGAIYYGEIKRREVVEFTEELRNNVVEIFQEMHQYYTTKYTPKVKKSKACSSCSLKEICLPSLEKSISVGEYMAQILEG